MGSGSRGNGTLIVTDSTRLLIDCGFTLKECRFRLARAGVDPAALDAVLVTHEHNDHASGVVSLARRCRIPIYGTLGTLRSLTGLAEKAAALARPIDANIPFAIGDVMVQPVTVPHDAREPVQYVFEHDDVCVGVLTDLGHVTPHVAHAYAGCQGLLVESNHDLDMLWRGSYPAPLKRRIAGDFGHLSNEQAADFVGRVRHDGLTHLVVGHLSEQNNEPRRVEATFAKLKLGLAAFAVATQSEGTDWVAVG